MILHLKVGPVDDNRKPRMFFRLLVMALFLLSGCAHMTMDKQLAKGQYAAAEKTVDDPASSASSLTSDHLVRTCYVYFKQKKYNLFFECVQKLEQNIAKGDRIIAPVSGFWVPSQLFPSDISVMPHLMKADVFLDLGNYRDAVTSAEKAYRLAESMSMGDKFNNWDRRSRIRALASLVMANAFQGNREEALKWLDDLENQSIGFSAGYQVNKEKKLALSKAYMSLGLYDKVLSAYSFGDLISDLIDLSTLGALSIDAVKQQTFGFIELPQHFIRYKSLYETGRIKEAKEGYDKLLNNPATKSNGELYWPILFDRGRIAESEGDVKAAIDYYTKAINAIETQRSTIHTEAAKIGFVGDKQKVYHQLINGLYKSGLFFEAFEYVERSKSRALVDLLASKQEFGVHSPTGIQIQSVLQDLDTLEKENRVLDANHIGTDMANQRQARGIEIKRKMEAEAPELATLVTVSKVDVKAIQAKLGADETLVEYYYSGDDGYAFVVTSDDLKAIRLMDAVRIAQEIEGFRKSIEDANSARSMQVSERIYERLFKPLERHIRTSHLIIVSHGVWHYLPFAALQNQGKFLIDAYRITHLPSASVLKFVKEKRSPRDIKVLLLGNPDLNDPRLDLKYAQQEVQTIAELFPRARLYVRDRASKAVFLKEASRYNYIHLATHGIFREEAPLQSGIFLAGGAGQEGFMSVNEIFSLNLNADLVTLSACETGLGKVSHGDDIVGFTRGFLYAGANAIVSSLWRVDDLATSFLMTTFYANLKTMGKGEALRQAQLAAKKKYPSPYHWAAFQLTGKGD